MAKDGADIGSLLTKFFDYYPRARREALDQVWGSTEKPDSPWVEVHPHYVLYSGWRVLGDGREVEYDGGFDQVVPPGTQISLFPPGR